MDEIISQNTLFNEANFEQPENNSDISITEDVLKLLKSNDIKELQL